MNGKHEALRAIARFFHTIRYGYEGHEGYRKSTDLFKMIPCVEDLKNRGLLDPHTTSFLDLGCADGRVNLMMSYFVRNSIGIEIDEEILKEFEPRRAALNRFLKDQKLQPIPETVHLFSGDSLKPQTHEKMKQVSGVPLQEVDLFYTYIILHDLFGEMIAEKAKKGALYLVYGFSQILPSYEGMEILIPDVGSQGIATLYKKT